MHSMYLVSDGIPVSCYLLLLLSFIIHYYYYLLLERVGP